MSESVTSYSKTVTETEGSDISDSPQATDRWSYNITYRQLVISSCVGIFQLTWHPYIYDLRRLLPFLFLYNVFSMVVAYPMFYLELAIGVVTKKSVLNCWDLEPVARGVGYAMLICCLSTAMAAAAIASRCLALFVHSMHIFLPWLHCAADAKPPCAARHRPMLDIGESPAQSFYYNFVLDIKRDGLQNGLGYVVWELGIYFIISCFIIYLIAFKRIYGYSKLVLIKDCMAFFILLCCMVGSVRLIGWRAVFYKSDWNCLFEDIEIWRDALEYSLVEMCVSQGTLIMLGSYLPKEPHRLGCTALLALLASKTTCLGSNFVLAAVHGALLEDYRDVFNISKGTSPAIILWADFVARTPGSQFWSALVFFTLFLLAVSTGALLLQTMMSTFTGRSLRKVSWAFLVLICLMMCFIGIITLCTQGGQYILDFLMIWPVCIPRIFIAAFVAGIITYVYGQSRFCEEVFFAVGEYPNLYMRVCWALSPAILMVVFLWGINSWPKYEATAGWTMLATTLIPIGVVMFVYWMFKFRTRNIVQSEK